MQKENKVQQNYEDNIVVLAVLSNHKDSREGQMFNVAVVDLTGDVLLDTLADPAPHAEVIHQIKALTVDKTACAFDACNVVRVINNTASSANLNPLFAYNDVKCVMTEAAERYDYVHDYITLALTCKHANVKQILPANNALNDAKSVAAIIKAWNQTITARQSYEEDVVVIKDVDFTPYSCTKFFIRCKISINGCEFFEYKTEFRDKGYEPFDDFDKADRAYLFAHIEQRAHGNKYLVAYQLIDEPLSQLVIDWENSHDGVG